MAFLRGLRYDFNGDVNCGMYKAEDEEGKKAPAPSKQNGFLERGYLRGLRMDPAAVDENCVAESRLMIGNPGKQPRKDPSSMLASSSKCRGRREPCGCPMVCQGQRGLRKGNLYQSKTSEIRPFAVSCKKESRIPKQPSCNKRLQFLPSRILELRDFGQQTTDSRCFSKQPSGKVGAVPYREFAGGVSSRAPRNCHSKICHFPRKKQLRKFKHRDRGNMSASVPPSSCRLHRTPSSTTMKWTKMPIDPSISRKIFGATSVARLPNTDVHSWNMSKKKRPVNVVDPPRILIVPSATPRFDPWTIPSASLIHPNPGNFGGTLFSVPIQSPSSFGVPVFNPGPTMSTIVHAQPFPPDYIFAGAEDDPDIDFVPDEATLVNALNRRSKTQPNLSWNHDSPVSWNHDSTVYFQPNIVLDVNVDLGGEFPEAAFEVGKESYQLKQPPQRPPAEDSWMSSWWPFRLRGARSVPHFKAGFDQRFGGGQQEKLEATNQRLGYITDESLESTRRMQRLAEESGTVGSATIGKLRVQGEQLDSVEENLGSIKADLKTASKELGRMEKMEGIFGMLSVVFCSCCESDSKKKKKGKDGAKVEDKGSRTDEGDRKAKGEDGRFWPACCSCCQGGGRRNEGSKLGSSSKAVSAVGSSAKGEFIAQITKDSREEEMEENMQRVSNLVSNLRTQAQEIGSTVDKQNAQLGRLAGQTQHVTDRFAKTQKRIAKEMADSRNKKDEIESSIF